MGAVFLKELGIIRRFFRHLLDLFTTHQLTTSAAGLSYYITMTFFPLLICLYTLLGNNYDQAVRVIEFLQPLVPEGSYSAITGYMEYVSDNYSITMMVLALSVILFTASAGVRSLESTIGRMQGRRRYEGVFFFFFSVVLSLAFLFTVYFGIVVMFTGESMLSHVSIALPYLQIDDVWVNMRYPLLFVLAFILHILVYVVCRSREQRYSVVPGALMATLLMVGVSALFSLFINASIKYPLLYSSLASLILIMFWLYCCCLVVYIGAAINIALWKSRQEKNSLPPEAEREE